MSDAIENPEAEILFGDILEYIEAAGRFIRSDQIESLEQLNTIVDELNARVAQLSADVIEQYQPEMDYLAEQLRGLTSTMADKRAAMAQDLDVVEKRLRVMRAYNVTTNEGE